MHPTSSQYKVIKRPPAPNWSRVYVICAGPGCLQQFGEDIAILAGDALLSLSFEYIARETRGVDAARVLRVPPPHPPSPPTLRFLRTACSTALAGGKPLCGHTKAGRGRTSICGTQIPAPLRGSCLIRGRASCDAQPLNGEEVSLLWAAEFGRVGARR